MGRLQQSGVREPDATEALAAAHVAGGAPEAAAAVLSAAAGTPPRSAVQVPCINLPSHKRRRVFCFLFSPRSGWCGWCDDANLQMCPTLKVSWLGAGQPCLLCMLVQLRILGASGLVMQFRDIVVYSFSSSAMFSV